MKNPTFAPSGAPAEATAARYPVNEVMLKTLLCTRRSLDEIARICSISRNEFAHLRDSYGV